MMYIFFLKHAASISEMASVMDNAMNNIIVTKAFWPFFYSVLPVLDTEEIHILCAIITRYSVSNTDSKSKT